MKKFNVIFYLMLLPSIIAASEPYQADTVVPSASLRLLDQAEKIQSVPADTRISFIVWLKLRNKHELDRLVQDIYDPHSPRYHQFLSKNLYEKKFAPSRDAENIVQQYFTSNGLTAVIVNHSVRVEGSVDQVEKVLNVKMNYYRYQGKVIYANSSFPRLNVEIAQYISDISGLDTIPRFHANVVSERSEKNPYHQLQFIWRHFVPAAVPTDISLQGFTGANLQKAYGLSNIPPVNGVHLDGKGQTIIIVDKCGTNGPDSILRDANQYFNENDITTFKTSGFKKNFAIVNPDGSPFTTCQNASSFSQEIILDIESSHTIAPGDNTVLVLGSDQKTLLIDTINTLIDNNFTIAGFSNAYVISNSWSGVETGTDAALESTLELAAASGVSVNFSSGDCGDNTYSTQKKCTGTWPSSLKVDYPSSSAYVTAVGATALFVDSSYRYAFETVWGKVKSIDGDLSYDGGTSGGISQYNGPVSWQSSIYDFTAGGYGVISAHGNRRSLPDISMLGDPGTGLLIISDGEQVQDGGTSLACPLFSASLVLVNQARSLLNKGTPIGLAAPYLYEQNELLLTNRALNLIVPPAVIISGATPPPSTLIHNTPAPASAFTIHNTIFGWDSALTVEPESQFWNDAVGVGSPNLPKFISMMANM